MDRYSADVLAKGWQKAGRPVSRAHVLARGEVVEDAMTGFCGAVVRWESGLVVLEDRHGRRRTFALGAGFLLDGAPVTLNAPAAPASATRKRTASGSVAGPVERAKVALPSRIFVEGRHDAELVEKIWGDDLRHVGVVVEFLGGIDDLPAIVADFRPERGRRLGVLLDHLVPGSKESVIADQVRRGPAGGQVLVLGHPFIDIWQSVRPERVGLRCWPEIPRDVEWKHGVSKVLGRPYASQADIAQTWQWILGRVRSWTDLETPLLTVVEQLIDFVTEPVDPV